MREINNYQYQRYHFYRNEKPDRNLRSNNISDERRREADRQAYQKFKDNAHLQRHEDGSYVLYAVNAEWINQWRDFLNKKGDIPGPICNKNVALKINSLRR